MVGCTQGNGIAFDTAILARGIFGVVKVFSLELVWMRIYRCGVKGTGGESGNGTFGDSPRNECSRWKDENVSLLG